MSNRGIKGWGFWLMAALSAPINVWLLAGVVDTLVSDVPDAGLATTTYLFYLVIGLVACVPPLIGLALGRRWGEALAIVGAPAIYYLSLSMLMTPESAQSTYLSLIANSGGLLMCLVYVYRFLTVNRRRAA
jgi:hypothetical protein